MANLATFHHRQVLSHIQPMCSGIGKTDVSWETLFVLVVVVVPKNVGELLYVSGIHFRNVGRLRLGVVFAQLFHEKK